MSARTTFLRSSKGCFEAGPQVLPHLKSATNLKEELDVGKLLVQVSEAQKGNFHDACIRIDFFNETFLFLKIFFLKNKKT